MSEAYTDKVWANKNRIIQEFEKKVLKRKIVGVEYDDNNYPIIRLDNGTGIWIQRDDENNGPGVPVHVDLNRSTGEQVETGLWEFH